MELEDSIRKGGKISTPVTSGLSHESRFMVQGSRESNSSRPFPLTTLRSSTVGGERYTPVQGFLINFCVWKVSLYSLLSLRSGYGDKCLSI